MPPEFLTQPDNGPDPTGTPTAPAGHGRLQAALDTVTNTINATPHWIWYGAAGTVITAGLISSIRIAIGRKTTKRQVKSDKFLTFLAAGVATGVVSTGMWKFFGDVLHIANPFARVALFAFFEIAMLASAFRSRRFRLDRAAKRETHPDHVDPRIDVDGIAVWVLATLSGLFASADEPTTTGKLVRVVAPLLAAWMWERGLAGELMQFTRSGNRPNMRITTERVLVWLRLAEPAAQEVGAVDRKRRVAQFARTAYRLHMLTDNDSKNWLATLRVAWLRWRLRRQTEAANEHLKLATDSVLLGEVRAQLALLYGVEAGTSRDAVRDLTPLRPPTRLAIAATPYVAPTTPPLGECPGEVEPATGDANPDASEPANDVATDPATQDANSHANEDATEPAIQVANEDAKPNAIRVATRRAKMPAIEDANTGAHPNAIKLAKWLAKYPDATNLELAKRMPCGERTVSRYRAEAEAFIAAQNSSEQPKIPETFPLPKAPVTRGVNGHHLTRTETTA